MKKRKRLLPLQSIVDADVLRLVGATDAPKMYDLKGRLNAYEKDGHSLMNEWGYSDIGELQHAATQAIHIRAETKESALFHVLWHIELVRDLLNKDVPSWKIAAVTLTLGEYIGRLNLVLREQAIFAGLGTMQSPGRTKTVTDKSITEELDRQHGLHPNWGITALRDEVGRIVGLSGKQIYRRTRYDPRK